ncbi:methyltransferase [Bacterioplanes sanyensis]|uniref:Methyltransferase n=1 Tax=Bacterioplanes sanyensis TaxID=1249553 RepID=A0A222FK48_9GAMM|nr:class I SAM-dependent methyltransferase [Bacterioplanes sanyensis]ASP39119.1 methyltransferase [Bacterioplanes sanyensis]
MTTDIRLLESEQTIEFDTEYVDSSMFSLIRTTIQRFAMSDQALCLLDVGGGNGKYADRFLASYSDAHCTVLEPETYLAGKNRIDARKTVISDTFQGLTPNGDFNLIQFNWVLHHFVSDSYKKTCQAQKEGLSKAMELLQPGGLVLIFENFYDGFMHSDLPSRLIYQATASTWLKYITKRMGANTAGVGVGFHSESYWTDLLEEVGFVDIESMHCYDFGNLTAVKKLLLAIQQQHVGFIVARKPD